MNSTDAILGALNASQHSAVTSDPGRNTLVLAGAGSGKTRVLTRRFAWLVATQGIHPREALTVTFTNKAATEMRERIVHLLGRPAGGLWVGTFHALCRRMLLRFHAEAGLPGSFQILDREDQKTLMRQILRDLDQPRKARDITDAIRWVSIQKREGLRARHVEPSSHRDITYVQIMKRYEKHCARGGLVDFDELLLRCVELLREHSAVRQHYHQRFCHFLVDEFQDVDNLQNAWLRLLTEDGGPLFVVGDDDQSIYGWRGARPKYILDFKKNYDNVQVYSLEQNYRSTTPILKAANMLIVNNRDRLQKHLWSERQENDPVMVFGALTGEVEAAYVVARIAEWGRESGRWSECAVLYRTNRQSQPFETSLNREGIPYRIYGGIRFFERREVKDALAYLRLCLNLDDDVAWQRVCNAPLRGIGAGTLDAVRAAAAVAETSLSAAARRQIQDRPESRPSRALAAFGQCVMALREETAGHGLAASLRCVLKASGLLEHYRRTDLDLEETRTENLYELVNSAAAFEDAWEPDEQGGPGIREAFLDNAALAAGERGEGTTGEAVQLMTLHMAKGLEFPLVIIAGLEEGTLPMTREDSSLEEERRLCYVGITRACRQLVLTHAYSRFTFGYRSDGLAPSRFLAELSQDPTVVMTHNTAGAPPSVPGRLRVSRARPPANLNLPDPGAPVAHPKFGPGIIVEYEGRPPQLRVQVLFENAGRKWLMYDYAKLEHL